MQKQKTKPKKHWTLLLAGLAVTLNAGCAGMPTPPTGNMFLHFHDVALCSDMATGDKCASIPMSSTESFVMFPPQTWHHIQSYIDELIRAVQAKGSAGFLSSEKDETLNALYRIKFSMRSAEKNWKRR